MKKTKLIISLASVSTAAIAPVIALASCGNNPTVDTKAIPESMLNIEGNILLGLKEGASIGSYEILAIPEDVIAISEQAFKDVFKEDSNWSNIKTVVLNNNLKSIGKDAFMGCDAITKLDLSKMQDTKLMSLILGTDSFTTWKNSGGNAVLPDGTTDIQKQWIADRFLSAGLPKTWFYGQPEEEANVDAINKIIVETQPKTFYDLVVDCSGTIDVEKMKAEEGHDYAWDHAQQKFFVMNSSDGTVVYPTDFEASEDKWEIWKMVDETTFKSDCEYSQYLKTPTTNALTQSDFTFIAGFDTGANTDVKFLQYNYDRSGQVEAKEIIINTPKTEKVNMDIGAWKGTATADGDLVKHFGKSCDINIKTNFKFLEYGESITCTTSQGLVYISDEAKIDLTYVKEQGVTLQNYKGEIDKVYAKTQAIKEELEQAAEPISVESVKTETEIIVKKEEAHEAGGLPAVAHIFSCSDGTNYDTIAQIAAASTAGKTFEGLTIALNKDYDMTTESSSFVPIGSDEDYPFKGTIDGQGHSIVNWNTSAATNITLIVNASGCKIKNLSFIDCSLNCTGGRACFLSLWNSGAGLEFTNIKFYNCNVTSTASNGFAVGYVLSSGTTAEFKYCFTDEKCWAKSSGSGLYQTGFVSQACDGVDNLLFEDCEMHLKISSYYCAGGYVGQLGAVNDNGVIEAVFRRCTSYGDMCIIDGTGGNGPMAGGFVGSRQNNTGSTYVASTTTFEDCINYSNVYADNKYKNYDSLGGFIGYGNGPYGTGSKVEFIKCINKGQIGKENTGASYIPNYAGGFFGRTNDQGNLLITFDECENNGYINATTAGHFMGLLDNPLVVEKRICTNCSITGSLRSGASRTRITGEPE